MAATADGRLVHELIVKRLFEVSDDYVADAAQQVQHCQQFELERCFLELNSGVPVLHACLDALCHRLSHQLDKVLQSEPLKPGEQFKHVQSGIVMLAKHAPQFAVDSLEEWRKRKVEELQERGLVLTSSKRGLAAVRFSALCMI